MAYFKFETNKPALSYKCGETMEFSIQARSNCTDTECRFIKWEIRTDDGKYETGFGSCEAGKPLKLTACLSRPGFVRITCTAFNTEYAPDSNFDVLEASAGAEIEKLTYCDTIPEDFDKYWKEIEDLVADFDCKSIMWEDVSYSAKKGFKKYDVRISTPEGRPASAIVTIPDKEGSFPLIMEFNGYCIEGSVTRYRDDAIVAFVNAHGIENDITRTELALKYTDLAGYGFNETENESNITTYWRGMMIRNLIATKFMKTLPQWDKEHLTVTGGSQGAFQATTVAAHDKDVTFLDIFIPWFCNLFAESQGYMGGWRPKFKEGLRYFDTVAQATRVKCPVNMEIRLGDYVCPPSTTVTLYNAFNCYKHMTVVQSGTHSYVPPEREEFHLIYDPENPDVQVKKGKYRHFKGNEYEVIYTGFDSESCEKVVVYKALYGQGDIWVRPEYMFREKIFKNGEFINRFEYID
ncbi:MAG: DUF1653 domain-containing protein [Acutalibacteraceae bacterium]|nr:DUF1653 domain-containing protein [Acutalibacteraceae bacterium]